MIVLTVLAGLGLIAAVALIGAAVLGANDTSTTASDSNTDVQQTPSDPAAGVTTDPATDPATDPPAREDPTASEDPTVSEDPTASDDPTASGDPSASPTPKPEVATARCWDGTTASTVARCSEPTGVRGLKWVFPSIEGTDCVPGKSPKYNRPAILNCFDYLPNGTAIELNYSLWANASDVTEHYDEEAYDKASLPGQRTRWFMTASRGRHKAALAYTGGKWSVTAYAPTAHARDRALDVIIKMRPVAELRGSE